MDKFILVSLAPNGKHFVYRIDSTKPIVRARIIYGDSYDKEADARKRLKFVQRHDVFYHGWFIDPELHYENAQGDEVTKEEFERLK